jgi:hypothetical protein
MRAELAHGPPDSAEYGSGYYEYDQLTSCRRDTRYSPDTFVHSK